MSSLVEMLRAALPDRDVPDEVDALLDTAVPPWATSAVTATFIDALARSLPADVAVPQALAGLALADLYLACGCAAATPAALADFEAHCAPTIDKVITARTASPTERADLAQVVRQRLLVAPAAGGPPRITGYAGKGSLAAWVRVVAAREAARMLPRERRAAGKGSDELEVVIAPDDDPEVGYLKRLYRDEFKRAFHAAVEALSDRDRLLLRQHALDGITIDQLGTQHGVHRATIARWLEAARDAVLAHTQRELVARLDLSRTELASIMRLIASQLDVSLPRVLAH